MKKIYKSLAILIAFLSFTSCQKGEEIRPLEVPNSYDASTFTANSVAEYELRVGFTAFINEVKKGRIAGTSLSAAKLKELFEAGNNSVSKNASATVRANYLLLFTELEKASKGNTYQFGKTPTENVNGGVNGGYLFDETGLELEQILDKASFGSIFYANGVSILSTPTVANLDKALALYGANPTFPNTPTATNTAQPDILMANYGARRTKGSDGLYTQVKTAFIKAQAAIKAGENYSKDRDEAIAEILLKWEEINAATVINYLFDVETKLASTNPTDAVKASAMHSYGECVGFLSGFKAVTKKKITDAQIDAALVKMNYSAPYKLIGSPTEIAKVVQLRKDLQGIYGFTDTQVEEFRNNYVSLEGR